MTDPAFPRRPAPGGPAAPPPGAPQVGDVLLGRYRVEGVLDEGGMGVVLGARHLHLDEPLAIKVMRPELARQRTFVERFLRESQAASRLKTEHVVRVFDVGILESGLPFMVMELLTGESLAERIQDGGALAPAFAAEVLLQASDAIAQAHALGIVHRDLKPDNLFLTTAPDGTPCIKVLDFGISKVLEPGDDLGITTTSDVFGSPRYMSPEQMRSAKDADARSDIWSLGAILYEMLSGRPSFDAASMPELSAKILRDDPPPLGDLRPELDASLVAVVKRCLEKDPGARYQTVAELAAAIAPHAPEHARPLAGRVERILKLAPLRAREAPRAPRVPAEDGADDDAPKASIGRDASGRVIVRTPLPAAPAAHTVPELPVGFHAAETQQASKVGSIPGSTQIQWEDRKQAASPPPPPRRWLVAVPVAVALAGGAGVWALGRAGRDAREGAVEGPSPPVASAASVAVGATEGPLAAPAEAGLGDVRALAASDAAVAGGDGPHGSPGAGRDAAGAAREPGRTRGKPVAGRALGGSAPAAPVAASSAPEVSGAPPPAVGASAPAAPGATAPAPAPSERRGLFDYRN